MKRLALLAPLGAVVFTAAWLVLGFVSPGYRLFDLVIEPYSPISQPVSGLGLGVTGPWMNAAFISGGVLILLGMPGIVRLLADALPVRSRLGVAAGILIAFLGVGTIIDGVFTLESVMLHTLGFLLAVPIPAVGFVLGAIALRRRRAGIALWLAIAGPLSLGLFALFMAIFDPYTAGGGVGVAGLVQRILALVVFATVAMLGVQAARRERITV